MQQPRAGEIPGSAACRPWQCRIRYYWPECIPGRCPSPPDAGKTLRGPPVTGNCGGRGSADLIRVILAQNRWLSCFLAPIQEAVGDQNSSGVCTVPAPHGWTFIRAFQQPPRTAWFNFPTSSTCLRRRFVSTNRCKRIEKLREPRVKPLAASQSSKPSVIGPRSGSDRNLW